MQPTPSSLGEIIAADLGIERLSVEDQQEVIAGITENIMTETVLALTDKLAPEDAKAVDALAEDGDTDELLSYLRLKIPNIDEVVAERSKAVIAEFKKLRDSA